MNSVKLQATVNQLLTTFMTFGRGLQTPDVVQRDLRSIVDNDNFISKNNKNIPSYTLIEPDD